MRSLRKGSIAYTELLSIRFARIFCRIAIVHRCGALTQPAQGPLPAPSVIASSSRASSPSSRSGLPEPHAAAILPGTSHVLRMTTPRATQARDELGLKARLHGTPPDDVGLDAGSSLREGTGLWGCDELGLKARLHGTPPDDVGLDAGSSLREGTGLWGWLWGPWRFSPAPRGYVHYRYISTGVR